MQSDLNVKWQGREIHNPVARTLITTVAIIALALLIGVVAVTAIVWVPLDLALRKLFHRRGIFVLNGSHLSLEFGPGLSVSDWIDELVDAALEAGPQKPSGLGTCPNANCYENWHGKPAGKCPGSHRTPTKEELDAIQSQGCLHWDAL